MEEWRPVQEFPNYEVSDLGHIRRIAGGLGGGTRRGENLSGGKTRKGYVLVTLRRDGKAYGRSVHRIVLQAFDPVDDDTLEVNHKDGVKSNNVRLNLEWMTGSGNSLHRSRVLNAPRPHGSSHGHSRFSEADIRDMRARSARGDRTQHIANDYGTDWTMVDNVVKRRTWKHVA